MPDINEKFATFGVRVPEIYLPVNGTDYTEWSVVACDQYSSERDYWENVKNRVGEKASTLNMIFPECYLEDSDKTNRIKMIKKTMHDYLDSGVLENKGPGFILVERKTPFNEVSRKGLVISVDLEKYEYGKDSASLIRPTEGTIVARLPPRMEIRRGAPLELPHIMLLIDDPDRSVIEPVWESCQTAPKLYDFELMQNSGHISAWHINEEKTLSMIASAIEKLSDPKTFEEKYGKKNVLLFAVGDGNHSLATAKAIWEEVKASGIDKSLIDNHPARYALVELVNIYDEGLPFHPIHRVLFNVNEKSFYDNLSSISGYSIEPKTTSEELYDLVDTESGDHLIGAISSKGKNLLRFRNPQANLAAGTIQEILDKYLKEHPDVEIDYIHGTESLETLAMKPGNLGLYLPPVDKAAFFGTVIRDGVMPRKTFSMGEAPEKRFYIESRRITIQEYAI